MDVVQPELADRSARKRRAVVEAATALFLQHGYPGTSMDQIAAAAAVSKPTVYRFFADKQRLFTEIVLGTLDQAGELFRARLAALARTGQLAEDLRQLARDYLATVIQPPVLQLRRLVIGASPYLPEVAEAYYERAPEQTMRALAGCFEQLAGRGLLRIPTRRPLPRTSRSWSSAVPWTRACSVATPRSPRPSSPRRRTPAWPHFCAAYGTQGESRLRHQGKEDMTMRYQTDPRVDAYIDALPGWQQAICREVRDLVHAADPEVTETIKRTRQPYFVLDGNICALLAARDHVNVFLYDGGIVPDPERIITAGHDNKTARTVAFRAGGDRSTRPAHRHVPARSSPTTGPAAGASSRQIRRADKGRRADLPPDCRRS